jgi:hypothetical protein
MFGVSVNNLLLANTASVNNLFLKLIGKKYESCDEE